MAVWKLKEGEFEDALKSGTVLFDFYADWCGPCKMIAPVVEEIAEERTDVKVYKVNVDEMPAVAVRLGISSIPTLVVYKNGEESGRLIGYRQKDAILAVLG